MPWLGTSSTSADIPAESTSASRAGAPPYNGATSQAEHTNVVASGSQPGAGSKDHDLLGVIDSLQQIRRIDPSAEQQLIARLREAPAESWPLVAEQFRSSLAYREQLASKRQSSQLNTTGSDRVGEPVIAAQGGSLQQPPLGMDSRPSAPFGALTDPRNADSDGVSSEAMARATPYSTPVPFGIENGGAGPMPNDVVTPSQFTSDGPVSPIAAKISERSRPGTIAVNDAVVHTGFNESGPATGSRAWHQLIEHAADELSRDTPQSPTTTAEVHQLVTLRMLRLLTGETDQALEAIPHLSPTEQDYWSHQMFALATYLDHHAEPDDKRRAAASVMHLDEAVSSLRELGTLSLRNLAFCKNVHGYGSIEPYDADRFSAGEQVSLYVEVENYHSRSTEKGYCTSLGSTYEILNDQGERVGGGAMPDVNDCCRSRRRDFHIQYGIALPKSLSSGQHRLNLVVKDRQGDKIGHASVPFEVLGSMP